MVTMVVMAPGMDDDGDGVFVFLAGEHQKTGIVQVPKSLKLVADWLRIDCGSPRLLRLLWAPQGPLGSSGFLRAPQSSAGLLGGSIADRLRIGCGLVADWLRASRARLDWGHCYHNEKNLV